LQQLKFDGLVKLPFKAAGRWFESNRGRLVTARLLSRPPPTTPAGFRTLSRIRSELERIPESCAMGDPVALKVQDLAVMMRQLVSRLL